jgi:hypothetical protein
MGLYGKTPHPTHQRRRFSRLERQDMNARRYRRYLIVQGYIVDPEMAPSKYRFTWGLEGFTDNTVFADDRSTARSMIKTSLGLGKKDRLPRDIVITRYDNGAS